MSEINTISEDRQLLARVAAGDENALSQLIRIHAKDIYHLALTYLHRPELAEEITQDVFTKLWLTRDRLREVGGIRDYLFIITRNTTFSALRKSLNKEPVDYASPVHTRMDINEAPDRQLEAKEYAGIFEEAIATLPEKRRQVFHLSREQGLTHSQIAEQLDIKKSTVNDHLTLALNFIRITSLSFNLLMDIDGKPSFLIKYDCKICGAALCVR